MYERGNEIYYIQWRTDPVSGIKKISYMRAIILHIVWQLLHLTNWTTKLPQFDLAVRQPQFRCVLFLTCIIYCWRSETIRNAFQEIFVCKIVRKQSIRHSDYRNTTASDWNSANFQRNLVNGWRKTITRFGINTPSEGRRNCLSGRIG